MVELPYDIWRHIAEFLPARVLHGLLGVHSAFLELALDLRYREVSFRFLRDADSQRYFVRLQDPFVAKRVHKLLLQPAVFCDRPTPKRRVGDRIRQLLGWTPRLVDAPFGTVEQSLRKISNACSLMSNLIHLHIHSYFPQTASLEECLPFLDVAWTTFGPNLRKLTLSTTLEDLSYALSSSPVFSVLELLEISVYGVHSSDTMYNAKEGMTSLIAFINNHQPTLQSLIFTMGYFDTLNVQLETLFLELGHFPCLGVVAIDIPWPSTMIFTQHILPRHADGLRILMIPGLQNSARFPEPVELPQLKALVLGLDNHSPNLPGAIPFLRPLAASLTILELRGYPFLFHEARDIINVFAQQNMLAILHIELDFVTPQFLDVCSEKLPGLEKLSLSAGGFKGTDNDDGSDSVESGEEMFYQQMRGRQYGAWNLRHLHINALSQLHPTVDADAALKELFPFMTRSSSDHASPLFS